VTPEMVGARKATAKEAGWTTVNGRKVPRMIRWEWAVPREVKTPISEDDDDYVQEGEFIYLNARAKKQEYMVDEVDSNDQPKAETEIDIGTATAGNSPASYTIKFSPWLKWNSTTHKYSSVLIPSMVGVELKMHVHNLTFWKLTNSTWSNNAPDTSLWGGLVKDWGPVSGKKYGPIVPSPPANATGLWKCGEQSFGGEFDEDGKRLLRINRTFIERPQTSLWTGSVGWNSAIYGTFNGDW